MKTGIVWQNGNHAIQNLLLKHPRSLITLVKTLHLKLDVPVGIIQRAYAGTPIEGWMPWDIQSGDPRTILHKKMLDEGSQRLLSRGQTKQKGIGGISRRIRGI